MDTLVREQFAFSGGTVVEDGPYPIVRGVAICGDTSKWGYDYLREAWTDETLAAYEGVSSYANHDRDGEARDVADKVGWFANVRRRADGRPEGDYCLVPGHPLTPRIVFAAKHNPRLFAMSHRADVRWGTRGGKRVVEGIRRVISVDVVGEGATTGGLYESAPGVKPVATTVNEYTKKLALKLDVPQLLKLKTLVKEDGYGDAPMPPDAPAPDADGTDAGDGVDSAFQAAITAEITKCMEASGDPAAVKACLKKIKKLLMAHGDINDDGSGTEEEPAEETEAKESAGGKGPKKPARKPEPVQPDPWALMDECVKEGFTPSGLQLEALKGIGDEKKRAAFIREQKGLGAASDPKSKSREQVAAGDKKGAVKEGAGNDQQTERQQVIEKMRQYARENQGVKPSSN